MSGTRFIGGPRMRALVVAVLGGLLCGCSPRDSPDPNRFLAERAVILNPDSMSTWRPCRLSVTAGISGFWRPVPAHMQRIESSLADLLQAALLRVDEGSEHPSLYYRQYIGIVRDGRRLVYVNGFHEGYIDMVMRSYEQSPNRRPGRTIAPDFWKHTPVTVCDGGHWFFGITYDPEAHRFGTLEFEHTIDGRLIP